MDYSNSWKLAECLSEEHTKLRPRYLFITTSKFLYGHRALALYQQGVTALLSSD